MGYHVDPDAPVKSAATAGHCFAGGESTQRRMQPMSYQRGRYSAKPEQSVRGFHRLLWADIQQALSE